MTSRLIISSHSPFYESFARGRLAVARAKVPLSSAEFAPAACFVSHAIFLTPLANNNTVQGALVGPMLVTEES